MTAQRPSSVTSAVWLRSGWSGVAIDQLVGRLRRAEAVEIDRLVVVARLEVLALLRARGSANRGSPSSPTQARSVNFAQRTSSASGLPVRDVEHAQDAPVGAAVLHAVEQVLAVVATASSRRARSRRPSPRRWDRAAAAACPPAPCGHTAATGSAARCCACRNSARPPSPAGRSARNRSARGSASANQSRCGSASR